MGSAKCQVQHANCKTIEAAPLADSLCLCLGVSPSPARAPLGVDAFGVAVGSGLNDSPSPALRVSASPQPLSAALFALLLLASIAPALRAAEPDAGRLKMHLDAGEFAPALALAEQAPAGQRDAWLAQVAQAQAAAGLRGGSLQTASQIDSDLARNEALAAMGRQPIGGFLGAGGGTMADFQSLIDLITSTVAPTTWDTMGGPGSIAPFPGGVWVDAEGMVHRALREEAESGLALLRDQSAPGRAQGAARRTSPLRKVSLTRLERAVQLRLAAGQPLDEEMQVLAGLQKIQFVFVYPETGDLVIAGPASDWRTDAEGRLVGVESGRPVLRLDDLVVVFRHLLVQPDAVFGCSITPYQERLARTKAFLEQTGKTPLRPGERSRWLNELRDELGPQQVEYFGLDPRTRVAQVLFEADYRMKLVGIGLEEGTLEVPSYLAMVTAERGQAPPLGVLRWWFALDYRAIATTAGRDAYELDGQGVQVLSENELLTALGQRVHTGKSDAATAEFAHNFTRHFAALAEKYPIYAELRNIFDLALVAALVKAEQLPDRLGWHLTCFNDPHYPIELRHAPRQVESVINHRVVDKTQIVAAVSGGVHVDPHAWIARQGIENDRSGHLGSHRERSTPEALQRQRWWWD